MRAVSNLLFDLQEFIIENSLLIYYSFCEQNPHNYVSKISRTHQALRQYIKIEFAEN